LVAMGCHYCACHTHHYRVLVLVEAAEGAREREKTDPVPQGNEKQRCCEWGWAEAFVGGLFEEGVTEPVTLKTKQT
jgi:hypothetical protein